MKDAMQQFTLYDVFGYLFPGVLSLFLLVGFSGATWLASLLGDMQSAWGTITVLVIAYVIGHFWHALGNLLFPMGWAELRSIQGMDQSTVSLAKSKLARNTGLQEVGSPRVLLELCRAMSLRLNCYPLTEVYIARQGFYRSLTLIFLAFTLALLVQVIHAGQVCLWCEPLSTWQSLLVSAASLALCLLWFCRWLRFMRHEAREVVLAVAVLPENNTI
jgi:hypothetical protein